jgi:predicted negative regulator of RcsB-dependent stress response
VDRLTRKDLKTDKFAVEVEHSLEYVSEHRKQLGLYSGIAVAVAVIAGVGWYYTQHQRVERQAALAKAIAVAEADIGAASQSGAPSFPTQEAKNAAKVKVFTELANKYPGKEEALIAALYLGAAAADKGDLAGAEKQFRTVAESGKGDLASQAKLSLAQIYTNTGKPAEAEKLLRDLLEHPTVFVSKEQATLNLARLLASSKPAEARKLLQPLVTGRAAASQAAIQAMAQIP